MFRSVALSGALCIGLTGASAASVIDFELDVLNSSVQVTGESGFCIGTCSLNADISSGFGGSFSLGEGASNTFDFIDWDIDGDIAYRSFSVEATLAFVAPVGASISSNGGGSYATFFGLISGGTLSWNHVPATVVLSDGSTISIDFEDGFAIFLGDEITTSATVSVNSIAAVPLPAALPLMVFVLGGMALVGRRRRSAA